MHMPQLGRLSTMTPAALPTGSTHNYAPVDATTLESFGLFDVIRQAANVAGSTITGLSAQSAGAFLMIQNIGAGVLTLAHESASSTAANRFSLPNAANLAIPAGGAVMLVYDGTTSRWTLNATGLGLPSISDDGATVGFLTSSVQFTRNADPINGTTFHARMTAPSGIAGKAPWVVDTTRQRFNSTDDPVLAIGYNHLANGAKLQAGEHSLSTNIEAHYNDGVNHTMEWYVSYKSADGLTEVRPIMIQWNRATDKVTGMNLGGGGPIYLQLSDAGTGGVDWQKSTSSARLRISGGSNELFQIGNISGITAIQIGPSAISGTPELSMTSSLVTFNVATQINGPSGGVGLTAVSTGAAGRNIDVKKGANSGAIRMAGGSDELLQIGNVTGITTVQIGPSAISGTAEIAMTATSITHAVGTRSTAEVAPAQITANQNDYSPTGMSTAAVLLLTSDASRDITGFATPLTGRWLWVYNNGAQNIVLKHQNAGSSATNRIIGRGGADTTLTPNTGCELYYSPSQSRWIVVTDTL